VPKIVDHEQRRNEVTKVAAQLVIREGRSALTVRNVAAAAG
jgi:AcrR family transcriptional regulator